MRMVRQLLLALGLVLLLAVPGRAQQVHRNDLGQQLQLFRGPTNVRFEEIEHKLTTEYAHKGNASETLTVEADLGPNGPFLHYVYPTPRAPLNKDLFASVWVKAKRKGVQLRARLVLPRVPNAKKPGETFTTIIDGDFYDYIDNWQKLEFRDLPKILKDKQQLLRVELNRDVDFADAYVDQLILNLYTGPGRYQVWVDEIELGPVIEDRLPVSPATAGAPTSARPSRSALIEINRDQLLVDGKRFLFVGIRHSDTPLEPLQRAGFHTLFVDPNLSQQLLDEAAAREFYLVPMLPVPELDPGVPVPASANAASFPGQTMSRLMSHDRVLFWYLGGGRNFEQIDKVARTASLIRENDAQRPVGADVFDGMWPYSRNVDLVGIHRFPLHTSMELTKYRDWLGQRKALARPGTFTWTWVQTHLPDWYTQLVYQRSPAAKFDEPIGPQPEQVRLLSYIGLAQGCRGIGFWSDRFLADSHQGRDRLLTLALLNLELKMLEPVLVSVNRQPVWIDTSNPQVKAAVLQGERGILVLPMWIGGNAQYVPAMSAQNNLTLTVPLVPPTSEPWEVSLGEVRRLPTKRVPGGVQITIPEFNLTSAVVFTGDNSATGMLVYWQNQARELGPQAAQLACDLAEAERTKVQKVHEQLRGLAPPLAGTDQLLADVLRREEVMRAYLKNGDYRSAYLEAQRALRPLRHLMRLEWDQAVAPLGTPTASPFTLCYYTLPKHWAMQDTLKRSMPGANVLRGGNFENGPDSGWAVRQTTLDEVNMQARHSDLKAREGKQCLDLTIVPKPNPTEPGKPIKLPEALERTFLSVVSPTVRLTPGTLLRISGWVRVPKAITASADGALLYDSIGGEPLAVRLTDPTDWRSFTFYRTVPASGEVSVTLALTGLGSVQFDDIRIEPMLPKASATVLQQ